MKMCSIAVAFCAVMLTGCSQIAVQDEPSSVQELSVVSGYSVGKLFLDQGSQEYTASFVQWNDEYAVTAKHVVGVRDQAFVCEAGCDLQFFRHKAEAPFAQWRAAVPQEALKVVGFNIDRNIVISSGNDANESVTDSPTAAYAYRIGKTAQKTAGGMSGGPVYAADKKVVGMHIGAEQGAERSFIYVPYELVQAEWDKFSKVKPALQAAN